MTKNINLKLIRLDGNTQSRVALNQDAVADYRAVLEAGDELPPIVLFFDGSDHWLADGFHRFHAYAGNDRASIPAEVRAGTQRDATLYSCGANAGHGLRRTNEDKRRAVSLLLADPEWSKWSDNAIAKACAVSDKTVTSQRSHLRNSEDSPEKRIVERAGKTYEQDTSNIGKGQRANEPTALKSGERLRPEPAKTAAQIEADQLGEAAFGGTDVLADMQKQIETLTGEIKAAEADDLKAEALKWRRAYDAAVRGQSEAMDRAKQATDREAWVMKQLRRCGKIVGQDDPTKIAAAVEAFVRANSRIAA